MRIIPPNVPDNIECARSHRIRPVPPNAPGPTEYVRSHRRLLDPQTVCNYVWMLKTWRTNGAAVNGRVVSFLRRLEKPGRAQLACFLPKFSLPVHSHSPSFCK